MVATGPKGNTVRALRGGQMTIPIEIRKSLGIGEDTLLDVAPTYDGGFVVHPVVANPSTENAWMSNEIPPVCRDPKDDMILATAAAGNADFIATEGKGVLDMGEYKGIRIVNGLELLWILRAE